MLKAIDPNSGECIREVPCADGHSLEAIMERSQHAYQQWRATSFAQRAKVLRKVAAHMRDDVEALAMLMTEEMGKPIKEARAEVNKAALCADHYAEHAEQYLADEVLPSDASKSYVTYPPLGPVLGILPWNAPFWLAFRFCAPALMAGNTCVMKHDPNVPGCGEAIARVFVEAGAPADIMLNLPLATPEVEKAIRHPAIQAVSFTGSERAGSQVAKTAAEMIKPSVLELGGSDPCIVLADADLEDAADKITLSRIINAGQSCIAAKRILVEDSIYDSMVEKLESRLKALKVDDPRDDTTDIGPIARSDLRDNLHRQIRETIEAGATCRMGGEMPQGKGFFYPVTLLTDVTPQMTAAQEETFGPVAVVMRIKDEDEAIALANATPYGLAASIWTERERGVRLSSRMEAGQVVINGIVKTDPRLPSGGIKRSGYGRELGPHGIKQFVNAKQVWIGPAQ